MTKFYFYCLLFIGFTVFLSSCEIEKQYHSRGYHIARNFSKPEITKKQVKTAAARTHSNNQTLKTSKSAFITAEEQPQLNENLFHNSNSKCLPNMAQFSKAQKFFIHPKNSFLPPDSVIIYDTVYEEEVLIIPDSIKKQHEELMTESKIMKQKSKLPLTMGYLLLVLGGLGLFFSTIFLFMAFYGSQTAVMSSILIAMGISVIFLIIGGIFFGRGMQFETKSRILARKAKFLMAPYEASKANSSTSKKASRKKTILLIFGALILYILI